MKRAIILVSFGTTYIDQLTDAIESIVCGVKKAYPTHHVYLAFSSAMISSKLKGTYGRVIPTIQEILASCAEVDYEEVIVQPLHLIEGKEYDKVLTLCKAYKGSGSITCGKALLSCQADVAALVEMLYATYDQEDTYLILLGHGTTHEANKMYDCVAKFVHKQHRVGQVVTLDTLEQKVKHLVETGTITQEKIRIVPLMLVAGKHIREEVEVKQEAMAMQTAKQIEVIAKGLGANRAIDAIVIRHIQTAVLPNRG